MPAFRYFLPGIFGLMLLLNLAPTAQAQDTDVERPSAAMLPAPTANFLGTRQYQLGLTNIVFDHRSQTAARQLVTAWQVSQGSWNGQTLTGVSAVLVQEIPDEMSTLGTPAKVTLYVSEFASTAQRLALVDALVSSHPELFPPATRDVLRTEPAWIQFESLDGQTLMLHLAPIA